MKLLIINKTTHEVEGKRVFTKDELELPGFLEMVESFYLDSRWYTERNEEDDESTT